ncbi:hypothetical protein KKH05_01055 [Patescibacteria group bacterium]|nr:hypothetical protein [Patescibacteria group bacterium]
MSKINSLKAILVVSVFGLIFSGYLTYKELFASESAVGCNPLGTPGTIFGYPPCVYGFFMYLIVGALSAFGLRSKKA